MEDRSTTTNYLQQGGNPAQHELNSNWLARRALEAFSGKKFFDSAEFFMSKNIASSNSAFTLQHEDHYHSALNPVGPPNSNFHSLDHIKRN